MKHLMILADKNTFEQSLSVPEKQSFKTETLFSLFVVKMKLHWYKYVG